MTAVALPELDLARVRAAVERFEVSGRELPHMDLDRLRAAVEDIDLPHMDLDRLRAAVEDIDLSNLDLDRLDLPHVTLPDLHLAGLLERSRRSPWFSASSILVGGAALLGGLALGGLLAFFLHPTKGARRRKKARRRSGRVVRRVRGMLG
jgi:hypothetical protein